MCTIVVLHLGTVVALVTVWISPVRSSDGHLAKHGHSGEGSFLGGLSFFALEKY